MTTVLLAGGGTGGHLMPALALGEAVSRLDPAARIVLVGAQRGVEATVLPARGVAHHLLPLEPIYRRQWWRNIRWAWQVGPLLRQIDQVLDRDAPDVVIGTGGYASGPVVWRAARRGIPTAVLELDVRPGIATRWLSRRAREVWVAAPEAVPLLPVPAQARAVVTGAPIVPPDPSRRALALARFGFNSERPVLVVTGGSQGSLAVNRAVAEWLASGAAEEVQVLWATGQQTHAEFARWHGLPGVQVVPFLDPMADAWAIATHCVARAGMMTIAELCAWGIPSILIPLPTAAADHQSHNARAMAAAGAAIHLPQGDLTPEHFAATVDRLLHGPDSATMAAAARARGRPDAATALAHRVMALVGA